MTALPFAFHAAAVLASKGRLIRAMGRAKVPKELLTDWK
jgi:hypothetical protein